MRNPKTVLSEQLMRLMTLHSWAGYLGVYTWQLADGISPRVLKFHVDWAPGANCVKGNARYATEIHSMLVEGFFAQAMQGSHLLLALRH